MAEINVSTSAMHLEIMILYHCEYRLSTSIFTGREKLLVAFNKFANRDVCIRTLDRYIHQLRYANLLKRWPRLKNLGFRGNRFTSAGSAITKKGLKALEWIGIKAFDIMKKIKKAPKEVIKKVRESKVSRTGPGSTGQIGEILEEEFKNLMPF